MHKLGYRMGVVLGQVLERVSNSWEAPRLWLRFQLRALKKPKLRLRDLIKASAS